jgi:hypothetical protein
MLNSGERTAQELRVSDEFARRWRDRKRQAERDLEDIRHSENALHRVWRRLRCPPFPTNPDEDEVVVITRRWDARKL